MFCFLFAQVTVALNIVLLPNLLNKTDDLTFIFIWVQQHPIKLVFVGTISILSFDQLPWKRCLFLYQLLG